MIIWGNAIGSRSLKYPKPIKRDRRQIALVAIGLQSDSSHVARFIIIVHITISRTVVLVVVARNHILTRITINVTIMTEAHWIYSRQLTNKTFQADSEREKHWIHRRGYRRRLLGGSRRAPLHGSLSSHSGCHAARVFKLFIITIALVANLIVVNYVGEELPEKFNSVS